MSVPRALAALAALALAAACGGTTGVVAEEPRALERYGMRIEDRQGWHLRLTRATVEAATVPLDSLPAGLSSDDVTVTIYEFEPDGVSVGPAELERSHAEGPPRPFTAS